MLERKERKEGKSKPWFYGAGYGVIPFRDNPITPNQQEEDLSVRTQCLANSLLQIFGLLLRTSKIF